MPYDTIITLEIERNNKALKHYFSKFDIGDYDVKAEEDKAFSLTAEWICEEEDKRIIKELRKLSRDEFLEIL